jgi:hypothetical protein
MTGSVRKRGHTLTRSILLISSSNNVNWAAVTRCMQSTGLQDSDTPCQHPECLGDSSSEHGATLVYIGEILESCIPRLSLNKSIAVFSMQ